MRWTDWVNHFVIPGVHPTSDLLVLEGLAPADVTCPVGAVAIGRDTHCNRSRKLVYRSSSFFKLSLRLMDKVDRILAG